MKKYSLALLIATSFLFAVLVSSCFLPSTPNPSESPVPSPTPDSSAWIVPSHPAYQWDEVAPADVPWDRMSHLIIGALWPILAGDSYTIGPDGTGWDEDSGMSGWMEAAGAFVAAGKPHRVKFILMLGGDGSNPNNEWNLAVLPQNIRKFAENIRDVSKALGCDGVDIDWENDLDYSLEDRLEGCVSLAKEIRAVWPEAIIAMDTWPDASDAQILSQAKDAVDAFMPMSFLSLAQWGGFLLPAPLSPLYEPETYSNDMSFETILKKWTDAGVPASKLVFGVGGFGAVWAGDPQAPEAERRAPNAPYSHYDENPEGEWSDRANDNRITQAWLDGVLADHPELSEGWDEWGKCSYWSAPAPDELVRAWVSWEYLDIGIIFYESPRAMREKKNYCQTKGLKGMNFWTLSQMKGNDGSYPMLDALR